MAGRRFAVYFSWSRAGENGAPLGVLENRYPTLFELRRAAWPHYEWAADPARYKQDVSGFLDHVILFDFARFVEVVESVTDQPVRLLQREHEASRRFLLDDRLLRDVDTLVIVSLDHLRTGQQARTEELEAISRFLAREDSCLAISPHHDVGSAGQDTAGRLVEFAHHGDRLVPSQQRIGGFARSVLAGLGLGVENRFGLNPAPASDDPTAPAPLDACLDRDRLGLLDGVHTFNLHPHLPHLHVTDESNGLVVLARQRLNLRGDPAVDAHPFVAAGNRSFNALVWAPPAGARAGHVLACDATLWSAAFGGVPSLERFWRNLAALPKP